MTLTREQRLKRIGRRTDELRFWADRDWLDFSDWNFDGNPLALGAPWPERDPAAGPAHFEHSSVTLPAAWPLEDTLLELNLGGEGLIHLRYADGSEEGFGLDPWHRRFPLRAPECAIDASVVARFPFGRPQRDARLAIARLVLTDPTATALVRQLRLVWEAAMGLGTHDAVEHLIAAAERAIDSLRWPSGTPEYLSRVAGSKQMQEIWSLPAGLEAHPPGLSDEERQVAAATLYDLRQDLLALRERFPKEGAVAVTGHAHLDLAWLWPLDETRRKAQRTYHTIIGLMDRYPEFRFNQSSAQLYAFVEEDDPEVFDAIRQKVALGRWEPIGGMWVEPDINMPAGESLVRQLLYGQRYFQRAFGETHTVCWLPDCFGFSPALPQILRGAGIEHFFTIKLTWSETNTFPFDLFWWEGLDGSRVLAHMFNNPDNEATTTSGYNGDPGPWSALLTWKNFRGRSQYRETLLSVGHGDGGGGVTPEMIEAVRVEEEFPAIPTVRWTPVREFYDQMRAGVENRTIPVWVGEMYLELHRGTLTTQGRTKYLHRRAERNLVAAEALSAMDHLLGGPEPKSLEPYWRMLLRNEFHDILPGSSIREVYQTAEKELCDVACEAQSIADARLADLAGRLVPAAGAVPDTSAPSAGSVPPTGVGAVPPWRPARALFVANPDLSPRPLRLQLGANIPGAQAVESGSVVTGTALIPGLGFAAAAPAEPSQPVTVADRSLENAFLRVGIAEDGTLAGVFDKQAGREALASRGNQIWAYVDKPVSWDAWDVDANYVAAGEELTAESIEVIERGPHRGAIRVVRRFRDSTVTQDIRLWANSRRLDFFTTIDWHDRRWLLKARLPLAIRAGSASFETAFGIVDRATHRNTTWDAARFEVAGHRFADLSEPGYGVALLNDGKYGHHVLGNELGISLLRSPTHPDPLADEGRQRFTYALLPHAGGWLDGGVLMEAEDLNRPLLAQPVEIAGELPRFWQPLQLDGLPLGLGALKVAEDGGALLLRAYEPQGARGAVTVSPPPGWRISAETDLLERDLGPPDFTFTPFQVHTWRLEHT